MDMENTLHILLEVTGSLEKVLEELRGRGRGQDENEGDHLCDEITRFTINLIGLSESIYTQAF